MTSHRAAFRAILATFLISFLSSTAFAQRSVLFQHLTVKEGLSQGSVICVFQDSKGFMWFGTQDGLNRFDGYECKIYKHDQANPKTISDNFVLFIAEDSAHTLWFGTLNNPDVLNRF